MFKPIEFLPQHFFRYFKYSIRRITLISLNIKQKTKCIRRICFVLVFMKFIFISLRYIHIVYADGGSNGANNLMLQ